MGKLTPHQKIMRAARKGTGVRLSADDVFHLAMDEAISAAAENDDADQKEAAEELAKANGGGNG